MAGDVLMGGEYRQSSSQVSPARAHVAHTHFEIIVHSAVIIIFLVYTVTKDIIKRRRRSSTSQHTTPNTPELENAPPKPSEAQTRQFGRWTPSPFVMPTPDPYPNWTITDTAPLPYRPFRYGPKYNINMGLRTARFADWIELDNQYPHYHVTKTRRIQERGSHCCKTAPEAYPAALELLQEFTEYLPARYPTLFRRTESGIEKLWSGEHLRIKEPLPEDPIQTCGRLIQGDLAIMIERADGQYYFLSGTALLPGFWRLEEKFGMVLSELHTSGEVPQFREKLEKGMVNLFRRIKPEEMVARNNYFFQVDDNLAWSWSIGDEDSGEVSWSTAEKDRAIEHHFFRSERQTVRRLPKSRGVVFTIRTYFLPVTEICKQKGIPGRLASAVRS